MESINSLLFIFAAIDIEKTLIPVFIAVLSSGFVFGLFKIMPERRSILVQASENAVRVVNDAIGTLQKELAEARSEIIRLEIELGSARGQREVLERQMDSLRDKVSRLETEIDIYTNLVGEQNVRREKRDIEREKRELEAEIRQIEEAALTNPTYNDEGDMNVNPRAQKEKDGPTNP